MQIEAFYYQNNKLFLFYHESLKKVFREILIIQIT